MIRNKLRFRACSYEGEIYAIGGSRFGDLLQLKKLGSLRRPRRFPEALVTHSLARSATQFSARVRDRAATRGSPQICFRAPILRPEPGQARLSDSQAVK